jgi:hypothetical protein
MGRTCSMLVGTMKTYLIVVGNPQKSKPTWRWKGNKNMLDKQFM